MNKLEEDLLKKSNELIEDKLNKISKIFEISQKQSKLLEDEKMDFVDELNSYLEDKSELIYSINEIDTEFVEIFEKLKKSLPENNLDSIAEEKSFKKLQSNISEIFKKLKDIQKIDKINNENMDSKYSYIKDEITKINSMTSNNKYKDKKVSDLDKGFYVDQKK